MRSLCVISLSLLLLLAVAGCMRKPSQAMADIAAMANRDAARADSMLATVDTASLSGFDRTMADLLSVKIDDKLYRPHSSDSLIVSVMRRLDSPLTPKPIKAEALYYAGRVYNNIGDAPTALGYYQRALDLANEIGDEDILELKSRILSQTGYLLLKTNVEESIRCLKDAIEIESYLNDSTALSYDYLYLGIAFDYMNHSDSAVTCYNKAYDLTPSDSIYDRVVIDSYLCYKDIEEGNFRTAQKQITTLLNNLKGVERDNLLMIAIYLYENLGMTDSAMICAKELSRSQHPNCLRTAYINMIDLQWNTADRDSIYSWLAKYNNAVRTELDTMNIESVNRQRALYNYDLRVKEILKLKSQINRNLTIFTIIIILLASVIIFFLLHQYRVNRKKLELSTVLSNIRHLISRDGISRVLLSSNSSIESINDRLRRYIESLNLNDNHSDYCVPQSIKTNKEYHNILSCINSSGEKTRINWSNIDYLINDSFPNFNNNLVALISRLNQTEYRICQLLKLGLTPGEISKVLFLSPSAVSNARSRMFEKAFKYKKAPNAWDFVIRYI